MMERLLQLARRELDRNTERGRLVWATGLTAGMKVGSLAITFLASVVFARTMGPHGFGIYAFVMAAATVVTLFASLGIPSYLMREAAKLPSAAKEMRRWADHKIFATGTVAAIALFSASLLPQAGDARSLFVLAAPIPLLANLSSLRQAELKAKGCVLDSQWPILLMLPSAMFVCVLAIWVIRKELLPSHAMLATLVATLVSFITLHIETKRNEGAQTSERTATQLQARASLPFLWLGAMYLVISRTDIMLLGVLSGAHDAGIYAVSSRAAELVGFILIATNTVLAPKIATLYHSGNLKDLQRLVTRATRRAFCWSLPVAAVFIFGSHILIQQFYGSAFTEGVMALQILAISMLIVIATGPVGTILNMTGHEKLSSKNVAGTMILNVLLNGALIPHYGVNGAAAATGISLIVRNLTLLHWTRKLLGVRPTIFGS